ncbi:MAG: UDP-N-acetylmuramate--alanine ligase [Rhodobacterales bacterium]|nr:MAG: UDP-N-acetylmuramate--alanine ligase [Rhodobacterales bacterium]
MPTLLILSCLWVVAATAVAFLPIRVQIVPGVALLLAAPVLLYFLARDYGFLVLALALAAVLSMFRRPLLYPIRRRLRRRAEARR